MSDSKTPEDLVKLFHDEAKRHRSAAKEAENAELEASHYGSADALDQAWARLNAALQSDDNQDYQQTELSENKVNPQVTIQISIGEATNDDGLTLTGVIEEHKEVVDRDDFVEPAVVEHLRNEYGVAVEQ